MTDATAHPSGRGATRPWLHGDARGSLGSNGRILDSNTSATRLTSTATTGGLANPAVSTAEAGGAAGVSILAVATPLLGLILALLLVAVALRTLARRRRRR